MDNTSSNILKKPILVLRFIIIFAVSCGIAEIVEIVIQPHFSSSVLIFELLEHCVLVSLMLLFMAKFVANPIMKEIALRKLSEQQLVGIPAKPIDVPW